MTVDPDQGLEEALRLMAQHRIRRLPVVEEDGKLIGIVEHADVARYAALNGADEVAQGISE